MELFGGSCIINLNGGFELCFFQTTGKYNDIIKIQKYTVYQIFENK